MRHNYRDESSKSSCNYQQNWEIPCLFIKFPALSLTIYMSTCGWATGTIGLKVRKKGKHESISESKKFNGKVLTNILISTILSPLTSLTLKSRSTTLQFALTGDIDDVPIWWKTIIVFDLMYFSRSTLLSAVVLFIPFKS